MMRLNNTNQRFKTFLVGTATLLTLLATSVTAAKADSTATSTATSTVDATATTESSATPAKQVALRQSNQSSTTSSSAESSVSSSSTTTTSSTSQSSSAVSSSSTSSDTTEKVETSSSSSAAEASKTTAANVQTAAKTDNAEKGKQQTVTQQYTPVTTSQKGSLSNSESLAKASLMKLSYADFTALAAQAKLTVNGMSASDAVVTDSTGKTYSASEVLSLYASYLATYHWSIDDGVPVKAGDTATLTLPSNVLFTAGTTAVEVTNAAGQSIGTFSANAGSQTGTLTFNNYFELNNVSSRQGTLSFHVTGTDTSIGDSKAKINKVGWWLSDGQSIEWQVVANLGSEAWNNVTIVDQLGQYQTHNSNVTIESGSYVNGAFVKTQTLGEYNFETGVFTPAEGVSATAVTVVTDGNQMTIKLGDITTAINLFYSVAVEPGQVYTNSANANYTLADATDPGDGGTTTPGDGGDGDGGTTPDKSQNVKANPSLAAGGNGTANWATYVLFVTKTDKATGIAVPNAVYELQTTDGVVLQANLKTDKNGQLTISNLAAGTYLLVETTAPQGYLLDKTTHEIVLDPTASTVDGENTYRVSANVTDDAIPTTDLTVKKVWANTPAKAVTPVTVTLYLDGDPTTQTLTLNAGNDYTGSFNDLPTLDANGKLLSYTVMETTVPGFESSQTTVGNTVTLTNTYRTITVTKTDASGNKLLAGATFTLTDAQGNVIDTQTTDETGQVLFAGLAQGTYHVQETQAPAGYNLNAEVFDIVLDSQTNYQTVAVKDTAIKGSLTVTKIDAATKAQLANATFELRDANNQVVQTAVTAANGQLIFNDLALGTYRLTEVTAPTGYQLDSRSQQIVITADEANQVVTVEDEAMPTTPVAPEKPTEPTTPTEPQVRETPVVPTTPVQPGEPDKVMLSTTTTSYPRTLVEPTVVTAKVTPTVAKTTVTPKTTAHKTDQTLPQTDEAESVWLMVIGWLMFLLVGWFSTRRKRA